MSVSPVPLQQDLTEKGGRTQAPWIAWFTDAYFYLRGLGGNGTTATRPTSGLYPGLVYFDTDLGKPVFLKTSSPSVWVDATGATV